jgi:hypothetical protein
MVFVNIVLKNLLTKKLPWKHIGQFPNLIYYWKTFDD